MFFIEYIYFIELYYYINMQSLYFYIHCEKKFLINHNFIFNIKNIIQYIVFIYF